MKLNYIVCGIGTGLDDKGELCRLKEFCDPHEAIDYLDSDDSCFGDVYDDIIIIVERK